MKIIYISPTISCALQRRIFETTGKNLGFASLKFNRMTVAGLTKVSEGCIALSNPPLTSTNWRKRFVVIPTEVENEVTYKYIPFINTGCLKHICALIYSFFYVLWKGIEYGRNCAIVCDVLSKSAYIGALCASKVMRLKSVGIVTDLPWLVVPEGIEPRAKPRKSFLYWFTHYVFLTEQMNEQMNPTNKPYIVMEGLCEQQENEKPVPKNQKRTILYAGTLMEKYGIKNLVDGFIEANLLDTQLVIYGNGPYAERIRELEARYDIHYKGLASTEVVVEEEKKATLLVNPRPTHEEYTKYSFPSKNMEYMATGTPILTTQLPGIPKEYKDYVYYFEGESVSEFAKSLKAVMAHTDSELQEMGSKAKHFVLSGKNNYIQGNRIINLIKE